MSGNHCFDQFKATGAALTNWHDALDPNIERVRGRTGKWAEDENSMLKDAV
jgi:hypothetical protein